MMRRKSLWLVAILAAGCVDSATEPGSNSELPRQFDHVDPFFDPAEIAVNNYSAIFAESGLETFYKGDMALFNGGLSYGTSASTVHFINTSNGYFDVQQAGVPVFTAQPHALADHYSSTVMLEAPDQSLGTKTALGIVTVRETFAYTNAPDDDFIIVKYSLTNTTSAPITNLYVGYMADPDVHDYSVELSAPAEYARNIGYYDAATQSARVKIDGAPVEHAIISLSHNVGTYRAWTNGAASNTFPLRDPTTNAAWFSLLSGGVFSGNFGPADIRQYVGTAATILQPGQTAVYAFALVGGENTADVSANIAAARAKAAGIMTPLSAVKVPVTLQGGVSTFTGRITFPSAAQAALFDAARSACGGAPIRAHAVDGNAVDIVVNALDLDPMRRSGAAMHCAGALTNGQYFVGTGYPVFADNSIPVTRLTANGGVDHGATWSPDGSKIAYISNRNGVPGIYIMNATTGEPSATLLTSGAATQLSWSSTGKIAFSRNNQIFVINATGGIAQQLTSPVANVFNSDPKFSPDGSRIIFRRSANNGTLIDLVVMNADGTNMQVGVPGPLALYPEWIDNDNVTYTRIGDNGEYVARAQVGTPSSEQRLTPAEGGLFRYADLSPDGKLLAFSTSNNMVFQDMESQLHSVALFNPSNVSVVGNAPTQAHIEFSPDGSKILFVGLYGTNMDVFVFNAPVPLTASERAGQINTSLQSLIAEGLLDPAEGEALVERIGTVQDMIAKGNFNPAVNHVYSFINKVNALVNSRRLNRVSGTLLTTEANNLITQLNAYNN